MPASSIPSLRVLVVEDSPTAQAMVQRVLERLGHRTLLADNGLEAIKTLVRESVDLVVMDISMPVMDGLTATRAIRSSETEQVDRDLPIIALSGFDSQVERDECLNAGVNHCLTKPVKPGELRATIERLFRESEIHDGNPSEAGVEKAEEGLFLTENEIEDDFGLEAEDIMELYAELAAELDRDCGIVAGLLESDDVLAAAAKVHAMAGSSVQYVSPLGVNRARALERALRKGGDVPAAFAAFRDAMGEIRTEADRRLDLAGRGMA